MRWLLVILSSEQLASHNVLCAPCFSRKRKVEVLILAMIIAKIKVNPSLN
jgi:hypothetical protein